ncbi:MAG: hypothetical protein U9Q97_01830 [Acidobacteriota bacterium]|nr:hypothetical protein [Acidobacteriota bacterium]
MVIPEVRERVFGFEFRYFLFHEITSVEIEIVVVSHVLWLVYGGFGGFMAGLFIVGPIGPYMAQLVFFMVPT